MIRAPVCMSACLGLALLVSAQAQALSCLPPDPVASYLEADASPDRFGAVVGRLDFNPPQVPEIKRQNRQATDLRAQLVGHALGPHGFTEVFQGNIILRLDCIGPWCGRAQDGQRYLIYLKHENGKRVAIADPCGHWMFPNPSRQTLSQVYDCFSGGPCAPNSAQ